MNILKKMKIGIALAVVLSGFNMNSSFASGKKVCALVKPSQPQVVNCVSASAAGATALLLSVDCTKKGDAECRAAFPAGIPLNYEFSAKGEKILAAKIKPGDRVRLVYKDRLIAKKVKASSDGLIMDSITNKPVGDLKASQQLQIMDYIEVK